MTKNQKLLIIANAFISTKSIGGGDKFIMETTPYLAKKFKTIVITNNIGLYHWKKYPSSQTKFTSYHPNPFDNSDNYFAITLCYFIRTLKTINLINQQKYYYLITASQYFPDLVPALTYKIKNPHTRWIARIYHLIPPPQKRAGNFFINTITYFMQNLMLRILKKSDLIVTDNQLTKNQLLKRKFKPNRIKVLPNGINWKKIKNHKPQKKYIFDAAYIGRLDAHRGIFDLPIIWKKVVQQIPQAKLAIVGYGPNSTANRLKENFKKLKLQKNISFLSYLEHKKNNHHPLYDLIKSIKILLLPIHEGGFPLTVVESLTADTPVISYNLPVYKNLDCKSLVTIPFHNTSKFADTVIKLLKNKKLLQQYAKQAPQYTKKFDYSNIANDFIRLVAK